MSRSATIAQWLRGWRAGDESATLKLRVLVRHHLRRLAGPLSLPAASAGNPFLNVVARDVCNQILPPLCEVSDRAHFHTLVAQELRDLLVDRAREHRRIAGLDLAAAQLTDWVRLDAVLTQLQALDRELGALAEMALCGGPDVPEMALVLGCSAQHVERRLRLAKAYLAHELSGAESTDSARNRV